MPWSSEHIAWLAETNPLTTNGGKIVKVFRFSPDLGDTVVMSAWAKHFRNHYCFDDEIDFLRLGTPHTRTS